MDTVFKYSPGTIKVFCDPILIHFKTYFCIFCHLSFQVWFFILFVYCHTFHQMHPVVYRSCYNILFNYFYCPCMGSIQYEVFSLCATCACHLVDKYLHDNTVDIGFLIVSSACKRFFTSFTQAIFIYIPDTVTHIHFINQDLVNKESYICKSTRVRHLLQNAWVRFWSLWLNSPCCIRQIKLYFNNKRSPFIV